MVRKEVGINEPVYILFFITCVGVVKAAEMGVPCSPKLPATSCCSFGL